MIQSFASKETEELFHYQHSRQHSIRINQQWRICFVWRDGHCYDVEIVDYHF